MKKHSLDSASLRKHSLSIISGPGPYPVVRAASAKVQVPEWSWGEGHGGGWACGGAADKFAGAGSCVWMMSRPRRSPDG